MSFEDLEESQESGLPISLYLIQYGTEAENYWAYCDADSVIAHDGILYKPILIGREEIESSGGLDNKTLDIDITPNAEIVEFYRNRRPTNIVTLTIRQGHYDDMASDFQVTWVGRILSVQQKARFATISAEPIVTSLRRPGLRRHYQHGCPHDLYGDECRADQASKERVVAATGVGQNYFEFATGWEGSLDKSRYPNGFLQWNDPETGSLLPMTILKVLQDTPSAGTDRLVVRGDVSSAVVGISVSIFVGCNKSESDCSDVHDNIVNYGGQVHIPGTNPVGFVNQFY